MLVSSKLETCTTICYDANDLDCLFFRIEPSNENAFALVYLLLVKALTGILGTYCRDEFCTKMEEQIGKIKINLISLGLYSTMPFFQVNLL